MKIILQFFYCENLILKNFLLLENYVFLGKFCEFIFLNCFILLKTVI